MALVPTKIDRYDIKGRIGGGGMGTLYLARDTNPTTDRLVALKLLRTSFDSDDLRLRFEREAQALAELSHPNIVVIYDSGEFQESPFIVMEYVRGETIAESIKRQAPMALGQKLRLLAELCAGLAHAHEAGIIHRDIKPANLMVDVHGRLKILDFGIARVDSGMTLRAAPLTRLNVQIGTPGYMSPEQIETGEIDARSDLFAVGAVAYELISYHEAFPGATTRQIENKVLGEQPVPLASSIQGLDPAIADVIASALEKDVKRRCQSASELASAFERARARLGEEDQPPRPTPPPPRPSGERKSRRARAADTAYERALASYKEGAEEYARRSAMEAIAEDPQHVGAHQLLTELGHFRDVEPWLPAAPQRPTLPSGPLIEESSRTMIAPASRPAAPEPPPPMPSPPPVAPDALRAAPPSSPPARATVPDDTGTLLISPGKVPVEPAMPVSVSGPGLDDTGPLDLGTLIASPEPKAPQKPAPPRVDRVAKDKRKETPRTARLPIIIGGVLAVVGIAAVAVWLLWLRGPGDELLTIARPEGGTIEGDGIQCGTQGSQCTAKAGHGATVGLRALADAGFVFAGFTGDCAPAGRTVMTAARSCGASFVRESQPSPANAGEQLLTIDRPTGGTIEGPGIKCGTAGADCSLNQPAGAEVSLTARPDNGFTFGSFTGDCAPGGVTAMTGPRRCGATFLPAATPAAPATPTTSTQWWVLTITKPAGGTILGAKIKCGAAGSDCAARYPAGFSVALSQQAEAGYKFAGFVGDCSPAGRTVMSATRTCGATFQRESEPVVVGPNVLTVTRSTDGTVVGNGIDCGPATSQCSSAQPTGASIHLMAQPGPGVVFVRFTGDCDAGGTVVMSAARSCAASFTKNYRSLSGRDYPVLTIVPPKNGTIVGNGIDCGPSGPRCQASEPVGSTVHLLVRPNPGFVFVRFNGECDAGGTAVMAESRACAVSILVQKDPLPADLYPPLTITRPRDGTIIGNGIECGTTGGQCSASQPSGISVHLLARPDPGFVFARFTGDCDAGGAALMSGPRSCGAVFVKGSATPQSDR